MKKVFFTIALLCTIPGFSQCKYNQYYEVSSLPFNAIYFFLEKSQDPPKNDIKKIAAYTDVIFEKARTAIIDRAGQQFYDKIKMRSLLVNFPDKQEIDEKDESLYNLSSQNITYEIEYSYHVGDFYYEFSVSMDKSGDLIYGLQIPDVAKNKDFEKLTNVCDAIKTVKAQPKFLSKKVDTARLSYNDETGNFCWAIAEQRRNFPPGEHESVINEYYVNANTNKLEKIESKKETVIVPDNEPPLKKKKRKK